MYIYFLARHLIKLLLVCCPKYAHQPTILSSLFDSKGNLISNNQNIQHFISNLLLIQIQAGSSSVTIPSFNSRPISFEDRSKETKTLSPGKLINDRLKRNLNSLHHNVFSNDATGSYPISTNLQGAYSASWPIIQQKKLVRGKKKETMEHLDWQV